MNTKLKHSVPIKPVSLSTFHFILETLLVDTQSPTPRFDSLPERGNENIKCFIQPRLGIQPTTCCVYSFVRLHHDWP